MKTIKINESQPEPCPNCGGFEGYQYSDLFRQHYTSFHNADGSYYGGEYSSGKTAHKAVRAYCMNCLTLLPFKLIREDSETVLEQPKR